MTSDQYVQMVTEADRARNDERVARIAEQDLRRLVGAIGGGFHPDTRGDDYISLPDGITADEYERIVEAAFAAGLDVYSITLDLLHAMDLGR